MCDKSPTNSKSCKFNRQPRVAVLMGGVGEERKISLQSGSCVADALTEAKLNVVTADIRPDNLDILQDADIDVFFIALHGRFGEDGRLQQILEDRELIYTGSGPNASRLAFDKMAAKKIFAEAGLATPQALELGPEMNLQGLENQLPQLADRYVIKPLRQGSTIGISIVDEPKSAVVAVQNCRERFGDSMIEEFIPGREITVSILEKRTLPIIEIRTRTGFYDYHAKYNDERTEYLFDTIKDEALTEKINSAALESFHALNCRHFARVDMILSDHGVPYVLELNTIPGFTTHSLLPKAAEKIGLPMSSLCVKIIEAVYSQDANTTRNTCSGQNS